MDNKSHMALRGVLRGLRPALGITQKRVAELSNQLPVPISREFVASIEANGLPGTVKKFLSFAWLMRADLQLMTELSVITPDEGSSDLSAYDLVAQCKTLSDSGQHRQALALVLPAVHSVQPGIDAEGKGRVLVAAALAASLGGFWHLGRDLAEQALCCGSLNPGNHSRAALVAAQCLNALDREALALHYLKLVDQGLFEMDPHLAATYWHDLAVFYRSIGRHDGALEAAKKALKLYRNVDMPAVQAVLLTVRALLLAETEDMDQALLAIQNSLTLLQSTSDSGAAARRVHLNAGRVFLKARELWSARSSLAKARKLAESSDHDMDLFEIHLHLCELAQLQGNTAEISRLRRILTLDAPRFRLDRLVAAEYKRILD